MDQYLNRILTLGVLALLLGTGRISAQKIIMRNFTHRFENVCYTGNVRCMNTRVIIRSTLKVYPPEGAILNRYAGEVSLTTMESFSIPENMNMDVFWDAMLAKQYLTVAQGYFHTGTRYCAVNTPAHRDMLKESERFYGKGKELFIKTGKASAGQSIDSLLSLIEQIQTNTDWDLAAKQFESYYSMNYDLMKACIRLDDGVEDNYKCITIK